MPYRIQRLPCNELPSSEIALPLYSQPDFLSAFAKAYQVDVHYLAVWTDNEFVACLPIFERKKYGLKSIISPQLYYYHFITFKMQKTMHPNRMQQRKLEIIELISSHIKKNFQKISLNLSPEIKDIRGFTWSKLKAIPLYTYLVPLKTMDASHFYKDERNWVHKAEKAGIIIEENTNSSEFIRLMRLTNQRQQRVFAISEERHTELLEELLRLNYVRQFNALLEDKIIATCLIFPDRVADTVYAWQHYTDPAYFSTGVSPFFIDSLFRLLKDDYSSFDLCGANHPAISRYKAAFGANLELFFRIQGNSLSWK